MKTLKQVLLAILFLSFSAGFCHAQSTTVFSGDVVFFDDDLWRLDDDDVDVEDDDDVDFPADKSDERLRMTRGLIQYPEGQEFIIRQRRMSFIETSTK